MSRDERGSATPMVLVAGVLVLALGAMVAVLVAYAAAQHRVRGVADLSAVAGAGAYAGGQPCVVAARVAQANGARLERCSATGDAVDHVVQVEVSMTVGRPGRGLPDRLRAAANAGRLA